MTENLVPWLRSGVGSTPSDGGCIMQVIDWIHRNEWTDSPPCVHPVIRALAINVNDNSDDEQRQKLLDLSPRMMGTASDDKELSVRLAIFCARSVLAIYEAKNPDNDGPRKAIGAAEKWCDEPTEVNRVAANAAANAVYAIANAATAADYAADAGAYAAANAAAAADRTTASANYAVAHAAANANHVAARFDLLLAVLDEYDRITNRKHVCAVDLTPAALAMASA